MKLYEYESKKIFERYRIPVPPSRTADTVDEAVKAAEEIGLPVVLKAQVLVAGRGKAGGILKADTMEEVREKAARLLGSEIKGIKVTRLLVEKAVDIADELYLSIIVDRAAARPVILASSEGGVDIEEIARRSPEKIIRRQVDPFLGVHDYEARLIASKMGLPKSMVRQWTAVVKGLYRVFEDYDADLAEINPLAITGDGRLLALDAKVIVDDNAVFRHPELASEELRDARDLTEFEVKARELGLSFVELEGDIGIIGNGAGLTRATMDTVAYYGGSPANFLDIGGGASSELVAKALDFILEHPRIKVVFMNIFGGITRCDEVAKGILKVVEKGWKGKKIVIRLT
ncbi:MAG: ADP-forming succinate--CoA ligase subunit beta, partial [Candidatus Korarchaeota archaeon]|nr:ADP-forming succinate--CoA ligase subunit beta [Candidatus Korarchaeota archaeon]